MRLLRSLVFTVLAAAGASVLSPSSAIAAEKIAFQYGILHESFPVSELTTLAETGQASSGLDFFIKHANKQPEDLQRTLTREVKVSVTTLDRVLNSPLGDIVLDEVGKAIHPSAGVANREAMRSALVLSASDDGAISLIEVIQKYPTPEVVVEADRLVTAYSQLSKVTDPLQKVFGVLKQIQF